MQYRIEQDTLGEVKVEADKYWGAQTQRSLENFPIGPQASMPKAIIHAFALLKKPQPRPMPSLGNCPRTRLRSSPEFAMKSWRANWSSTFHWSFGRPAAAPKPI